MYIYCILVVLKPSALTSQQVILCFLGTESFIFKTTGGSYEMEISYNLYFFYYDDILYLCLSPPCGPGDVKEMSINLLTFHWSPPALSEGRRLSVSIWCSAEVLISSSDQYWPALVLWEFQFDSKCLMSSLRTSPPIISNLSCNVCNV